MRKLMFLCMLVLELTVFGEANVILKIGGNEINADAIKLDNKIVSNLFLKKYRRLPAADDNELISKIEIEHKKKKLGLLVYKIVLNDIKSKLYDRIVTPDVINQYVQNNGKNIDERIKSYTAFLAAANYVKNSTEKDKYKIAYQKYKELGLVHSYNFFENNINNEHYIKYVESQIKERTANILTNTDKDMIFNQRLSDYIIKELSSKDDKVKQHLQLSETHKCDYKDLLFMRWFIEQGEKMGVEIFDVQYGSSLNNILNPRNKLNTDVD